MKLLDSMKMSSCVALSLPRKRIAKIRCLQDCIECFRNNKPLPEAICYVPSEIEYKVTKNAQVNVYSEPNKQSEKVCEHSCQAESKIIASGEDCCNSQGQWIRILKYVGADGQDEKTFEKQSWVMIYSSQSADNDSPVFVSMADHVSPPSTKDFVHGKAVKPITSWDEVVEHRYSLCFGSGPNEVPPDHEGVAHLREMPPCWSLEHDEDLSQFLGGHVEVDNEHLGSIKNYVEAINVSTSCDEDGPDNLTDGDADTYWESDGSQGQHWIRMTMKKGTIIKKLFVTIDANDDNYMPHRILVMGGYIMDNLQKLNDIVLDEAYYGISDLCILEDQKEHYSIIEIRIKECKEGIDTRIHGIKIKSSKEQDVGLSKDHFSAENLVRFPKLENFDPEVLHHRSILIQRFIQLLDSVLSYIVPSWEYSVGSYNSLEVVRQFLPLSKKRLSLIETFLRESETCRPARMPKLYINRRAAADHKADPSLDHEYKDTVFTQIYEGLKPRDRHEKPFDYRWPSRYDQWWECKFLSEGIIDQGGGFRDSLSDLADELSPSASDVPLPLPFFIRAPNQNHVDSNVNRDVYVPNPACREFCKYEWIGKIMGACLRGKENLVLSLPSFVWKKMAGERVRWTRDYATVDEAEVKMIDNMANMDEEAFDAYFEGERTWTTVLSDGAVVPLRPDGADIRVLYEEREEYCQLVRDTRMKESNEQIDAMRRGLLQVVPQAVLDLMTWQELEKRICGDPELTVEALKRATHYEDLEEDDTRVKYMWEALTEFSNEDRSRFLRFVTGRRRMPAPLYICPDKGERDDALPESSTCSNTLYLPYYSSAKIAKEKIRYAAYNCIAIDTDMSPWDE